MKCENCGDEKHIVDIENFTFEIKERVAFNCCCKQCAEDKMKKEGYVDYEEYPY